jgi:hypothetical protein
LTPGAHMPETAGMIGFAALAPAAVAWTGNSIATSWQLAGPHHLGLCSLAPDKVISRSFAEWCGIFDFLGAVDILLLLMP